MAIRLRKRYRAAPLMLLFLAILFYVIATPRKGGQTSRVIKLVQGKSLTLTTEFLDCSPLERWICSRDDRPRVKFGPPQGNRYSFWIGDTGVPHETGTCLWSHVQLSTLGELRTIELLDTYIDSKVLVIAYRVNFQIFCDVVTFDPDGNKPWQVRERQTDLVAQGFYDAVLEKTSINGIHLSLNLGRMHKYLEQDAAGTHWRKLE